MEGRGPLAQDCFTPAAVILRIGLWVCDPVVSHRKLPMALELCLIIKFYNLPVKRRGT